jgi:hypothetical protein
LKPIALKGQLRTNGPIALKAQLRTNGPIALKGQVRTNGPIALKAQLRTRNNITNHLVAEKGDFPSRSIRDYVDRVHIRILLPLQPILVELVLAMCPVSCL